MKKFTKMRPSYLTRQVRLLYMCLVVFLMAFGNLNAQNTPIAVDNNPTNDCAGNDCWDWFNWSIVQDGMGNNIGGAGIAEDLSCGTTIGATVEYTGADATPDFTGTLVGANTTDGTTPDIWTFSFDVALTNPVFDVNSLENDTEMCFTDCLGNPLTITILGTSLDPGPSGAHCVTSGTNFIQITGTYDCIMVTGTVPDNDPYTIGVGTCLDENPPPPTPPCTTCPTGTDYELISLDKTGTNPSTGFDVGIIEINNVCIGSYEFLFEDLDVNTDGNGTQFGGWDIDGGTMLLQLDFCDHLTVQQLDIRNLEVESEVSVGTTISGSGSTAILGGQTLTVCSDPSGRMGVDVNPGNGELNFVKTDGPGCGANPNGSYTFGTNPVSTLYFKYHNPVGGCTGDYVGFRIGTCYTPPPMAAPVCPVEIVQITCDMADVIANGPNNSNTDEVAVDGNGNYFNFSSCSAGLENAVTNGTLLQTVDIGCAELVQTTEECLIASCVIIPPCATCPAGSEFKFINLAGGSDTDGDGFDEGEIYLDGVCVGSFDVLFSDLDVTEDVSGTQFGGWDNDGGVYALQLDFCDPLLIEELYIRNLEVESQVSIGTTISGIPGPGSPATLGGLDLTFCDGSLRMLPEDPPVNMVITDGPGCGANPNAVYTIGGTPVTTLYFQYHNPPGGCTGDYVGFKVGTCVTPPPMAIPVCPFEEVRVTCDMEDVIANGINNNNTDIYVLDGAGNYFGYTNCNSTVLNNAYNNGTMLQTVDIGCADLVETIDECVPAGCVIAPTCVATTCPPNSAFGYISLDQNGTNAGGFPIGTVELDNVKIGTYEFLFSDLDVSEDGNGTTFGGWDNDGGTMLLQMDFCEPLTIQELDIRNLEVESQVSIGTTIAGAGAAAVLGGQTLTVCDDPSGRMGVGPAPNEVITDGPGCGANPNGTYTVGTNPVTTLYFKYHNPIGGCRGDYVGFRIGACAPEIPMATPTCPLTLYEIDECPNDPSNPLFSLVQDANGNWFDYNNNCPNTLPTAPVQTVRVSPCATTTFEEICTICCTPSITCPNPANFECGDDTGITAWLNSYMVEICNMTGTSVTNNYNAADFPKCATTTNNITFSLMNAAGQVIADCVVALTVNAAAAPTPLSILFNSPITCDEAVAFTAPALPYSNNLPPPCLISGTLPPMVQNNWTPCAGGTIVVTYSGQDECGNQLDSGPHTITVNPADPAILTTPILPTSLSCAMADGYVAPDATFTNGLTGTCENSGSIAASMQYPFDACGGTIIVNYSGLDDCGNTLTAGPFTINVDPAPVPTIAIPVTTSPISCVDAENYIPPVAIYSNGLTGVCNISGTIQAGVDNFWDACGGTLVLHYFTFDDCGNYIALAPISIAVNPAPLPSITLPTLPNSLACGDAASYTAPLASYDNGLMGACNLSGNVSAVLNHFYDNCGGELQIIYLGEDDCGRNLLKNVAIIPVDPAPAPTIAIPNFPTSVSCSEAESYVAPLASYDNGLTGDCNISGLVEPQITYNVNANNGGTMTIQYSGTDDCGNVLNSNPVVVQVEPASAPTLEAPKDVPATVYCWDAASGYYPGNATYTNGESGFCENSGEIVGVISEFWNSCDGGYIIYDYSGTDAYGNELTPVVIKVSVLPDTWAPDGGCAPYEETMTSIQDVPEPDGLDYYFGQVAAGYYEACGEVVVIVIGDTGVPECNGNDYFSRVYTVEIADECGNVAGECSITFSGSCSQYICTMDQKFYSNPDEEVNGQSSGQIINALIDNGTNPIVIGDGTDCGFIIDDMTCIQGMLNSYGAAVSLPSGYSTGCFNTNNSLINQMVVTILNVRYNAMMNPSGEIDFGGLTLNEACLNVPGFILNELPANPTVNDLLAYANDFIACQCNNTCGEFHPNMAELTNLFWGINSRYNKCHIPGPCQLDSNFGNPIVEQGVQVKNTSFDLYPNPTDDLIHIKLKDSYGKSCFIEIFDARGQKVGERSYEDLDQDLLQFEVHDFRSGIYWVSIKLDGFDHVIKKFMVIN